jgi:predicted transposase YbfD/YdcC
LLDHFAVVEDPRDGRRILHPLPGILLLVVCGTIADCDGHEDIAAWGAAHIGFLRKHLPHAHGVPGARWLTILVNRINPALFAAAFEGWVRESRPGKAGLVAVDGKTSRRSHDRGAGAGPLHLVSAFATTARPVLAAEAVPGKAGELAAIPPLLDRLGTEGGLKDALVSIDAIATNAGIARAILDQGADWLPAVKANQPTPRAEVEAAFAATEGIDVHVAHDVAHAKGHGRIETRRTAVLHDTDWLQGPAALPARCACRGSPASSAPKQASRPGAQSERKPGTSRHRGRSPPGPPRKPSANTGQSRTASDFGARRHLRRGPLPPAQGPRRRKHGHRPAFRPQPRPHRRRQAIHQVQAKTRRMGYNLPRRHPRPVPGVTLIRSPGGTPDQACFNQPMPKAAAP